MFIFVIRVLIATMIQPRPARSLTWIIRMRSGILTVGSHQRQRRWATCSSQHCPIPTFWTCLRSKDLTGTASTAVSLRRPPTSTRRWPFNRPFFKNLSIFLELWFARGFKSVYNYAYLGFSKLNQVSRLDLSLLFSGWRPLSPESDQWPLAPASRHPEAGARQWWLHCLDDREASAAPDPAQDKEFDQSWSLLREWEDQQPQWGESSPSPCRQQTSSAGEGGRELWPDWEFFCWSMWIQKMQIRGN